MRALLESGMTILVLTLFLTGSALAGVPADTPDQGKIENSKRCIDLVRIRDLDVIDDRTIIFHMSGNRSYKNTLPYPCPMLGFERGIAYRTSTNKLCNVDIIAVLGYGSRCGLGMFEPYVEDVQPEDGS